MRSRRAETKSFSLVEVVLALGIAAFCLVSVSGLLLFGFQSSHQTFDQTAAAGFGAEVIAELKATPGQVVMSSPRFNIPIPSPGNTPVAPTTLNIDGAGGVGAINTAPTSSALYRVTLGFTPPAAGQRTATTVRVMVTWPALADITTAAWPLHYQGVWETVVNLDRN